MPGPPPRPPPWRYQIRCLTITAAAITCWLLLTPTARSGTNHGGRPQPAYLARISRQVFGPRWRVAACIAHYESTDGAWLHNGSNVGPWQISVYWHPQYNARRLAADWWYSARAAFVISHGGTDWHAWSTHRFCGV